MIVRHNRHRRQMPSPMPSDNLSMGDTAILICHFNWPGFIRPRQNLNRYLRYLASLGAAVYGAEAYLPGQTPATKGLPGWVQIQANPNNQVCFQKEALLNIAEKNVPPQFTKVIITDADLFFENPNWIQDTSLLLNHFKFVQPFESAWWTNPDGAGAFSKPATLRMRGGLPSASHPGFAIGCKRSTWRNIGGLYDRMIVGSGDMALAIAILDTTIPSSQTYSSALKSHFMKWKEKVVAETQGSFSWTPGEVWHEWHGDRVLRKYHERHHASSLLDPEKHVKIGSNGLLTWTSKAPKRLTKYVSEYFVNRQEDTPYASEQ